MPTESGYLYGRKSVAWTLLQPTTGSFCFLGMVWNNTTFGGISPDGRLLSLLHLYTGWRDWPCWYIWGDMFAWILQRELIIYSLNKTNKWALLADDLAIIFLFRAESGQEQLIKRSSYQKYVKYWRKKDFKNFDLPSWNSKKGWTKTFSCSWTCWRPSAWAGCWGRGAGGGWPG